MAKIPIAVAYGDGIGPEICEAVVELLKSCGAPLEFHTVEIGEKVYLKGYKAGIEPKTWELLRHTKAFLKAPVTTPQGGGFKSLNVSIRGALGLYANVRRCAAYAPFVKTKHPAMDLVIIRENTEDLYVGIEYRQSRDEVHALKVITRPGSEMIVRYAFDYARQNGRKKVTCFAKDNILKLSDGLFREVFDEISSDYPDIEKEYWIVDIGAAKMADTPEAFDVIVMPNLYGDILSDVAAQIAGSVGLAGSANIGLSGAMFEAIHGSAPRRAGQDLANPSGLLLAAVMMLVHLGCAQEAALLHNSWLATIEEGIHTYDIFDEKTSKKKVGTKEFAKAVAKNLGRQPHTLPSADYEPSEKQTSHQKKQEDREKKSEIAKRKVDKKLVGVDLFIDWDESFETLLERLQKIISPSWQLKMIGNRGVQVWPERTPDAVCIDSWRCRFTLQNKEPKAKEVIELLLALEQANLSFTHLEQLFEFDGKKGFSLSQDEQ